MAPEKTIHKQQPSSFGGTGKSVIPTIHPKISDKETDRDANQEPAVPLNSPYRFLYDFPKRPGGF